MSPSTQAGDIVASSSKSTIHVGHTVPDDEPILSAKSAVKEIAFGSIAGMVSEIFEYPFDLAKVRLQAQLLTPASSKAKHFDGPMHCLMQTWKEEGVRGLYRGLPAPIVGSMAETAALFVAYAAFQNVIRTYSPPPPLSADGRNSKPELLSIPQLGLASAGAGFVTSFVLTPIELVKCKMQVQMMNLSPTIPPAPAPGRIPHRSSASLFPSTPQHTTSESSKTKHAGRVLMHNLAYKSTSATIPAAEVRKLPGPIALTRSIIDAYGIRGLWLGHTGTLLRETGGCSAWFVTKEYVARKLVEHRIRQSPFLPMTTTSVGAITSASTLSTATPKPRTIGNTELLTWESALSGAIAGAVGALLFYPADTVKSAIQTEEELQPRSRAGASAGVHKQSTFLGTFRKMWVKHGVRGLYAGCGMTVARAVPSSGIIFVVYDGLSAWFS